MRHQLNPHALFVEMDETTFQLAVKALEERAQSWGSGHPYKRRDNVAAIKLRDAYKAALANQEVRE